MIDRLFAHYGKHIRDGYPAKDYLPLHHFKNHNPALIIATGLQMGLHLAADGGLMRVTRHLSTKERPIRIPLKDYRPDNAVTKATKRMLAFHTLSTMPAGMNASIVQRHYTLKSRWAEAMHGMRRPFEVITPLRLFDQRSFPGNVFEMRDDSGRIVAAGLATPSTGPDGQRHVYDDSFYYDPDLRKQGLKPGFGIIGAMMGHYADLGYEAFYMGTWSPSRDHSYFYKMNLARNTQVFDHGRWVDARAYRRELRR